MVSRPMKPKKPSPNALRLLLGLYVLVSLSYLVAETIDFWGLTFHSDNYIGEPFKYDNDTRVISDVQSEAKAVGLGKGDILESLNGAPYTGLAQWMAIRVEARVGDTMDVEFSRPNGTRGMATITLVARTRPYPGVPAWVVFSRAAIAYTLLPLICLLIGYWVVLAKPTEPNAWLLLVLLTFPSALFSEVILTAGIPLFLRVFWYNLIQYIGTPALLLFGVYFPERSRIDVKLPWLKWLLLIPTAIGFLVIFPILYSEYYLGGVKPPWLKLESMTGSVLNFVNLMGVLLYMVLTLDKLRSASTEDARRRLRVLTTGMSIGMGSLLLVFILLPHFGIDGQKQWHFWVRYPGLLFFMVAPLTLAYVVLVQRALDVRVLVRTGTRYLLAKAFLWVVQFGVLTWAAVMFLLPALTHKSQPGIGNVIGPLIFVVFVFALRLGVRKQLQHWLDRKFFREAYDAELMLNELSDEARRFTETQPLLETVGRRVAETLHVGQITMLLRRGEYFHMQQSIGATLNGNLMLPVQSSAVRYLSTTNEPARLYRNDPDAWYLMAGTAERHALDVMNAELLLPLPGRNRLMGVMALGPKRSEAAYSRNDLRLLQAVASQTGLALEVSELAHSLATEAAQRERVNREMEIAREVQERLFPQEMPIIPGATVAGACRPALGVGGDYYDVIDLGDGRVGLAVGDVSGKGISAALLMASLRASLRGVTLDSPRDFAKLMHKVNRLVYEASASNRYATFFFAAYDPVTRQLDCVNAGHNPPLLLRGSEIIRLEADGPVVGLLPHAPYTEQSLTLQPGDLLVLYTDGISEAMTHKDEEWGDERMIVAAQKSQKKNASEVLIELFAATDSFTAGAPQHDDMTLLVLKLEERAL